jgi:WXXGXW repeat (2 copies)
MRSLFSVRTVWIALGMLALSAATFAQIGIGISVAFAPPELPVYEQPLCPGDGYIWTPGYWAWDGDDYYWVPGTWVVAPEIGFFWTPAYWGWEGGRYFFHAGYWGPQVGFYGGIDYGFGYFGHGYEGGRWDHGHFFYNRSVNNINVTEIHNVYNTTVVNRSVNRVSYNGGNGGINARPTAEEESAVHERHIAPVAAQNQHMEAARANPELRASANHGKPPIAATPKAGAFTEHGTVAANSAGRYNPPNRTETSAARPNNTAVHPNELPPAERPSAPNTGNQKQDQKYQKQQDKLYGQQQKERQKLQQQQEKEHQKVVQQNANEAKKQQMEQHHQQQTQQLAQKHVQQQQQMQARQQPQHPQPQQQAKH